MVTVSIVSHGHARLCLGLLESLGAIEEIDRIIIRINDKSIENTELLRTLVSDKRCDVYFNEMRYGFAKNNNLNFAHCESKYFFILNPDTRMIHWNRKSLFGSLIIPKVVNLDGSLAENGRSFLTPRNMILRLFGFADRRKEWFGGMAILIASSVYEEIGGFDEGYRLYVEDCDLFYRAKNFGYLAREDNRIIVMHEGQRDSRRKLRHLVYHIMGLLRFWRKNFCL